MDAYTQKSKRPKLDCLDMTSIEDALPTTTTLANLMLQLRN